MRNKKEIKVGNLIIGGNNPIVIQSMTIQERRHPEILKASRKLRIAKGCAMQVSDVNQVLKKYEQMKQAMKQMKSQMGRYGRSF